MMRDEMETCPQCASVAHTERLGIAERLRWRIVQLRQLQAPGIVGVALSASSEAYEAVAEWDADVATMAGDSERLRAMLAVLAALKRDYPDAPQASAAETAVWGVGSGVVGVPGVKKSIDFS